jgi:hypothetical protein
MTSSSLPHFSPNLVFVKSHLCTFFLSCVPQASSGSFVVSVIRQTRSPCNRSA